MGIFAPSYTDDEVCEIHGSAEENVSRVDGVSASVALMCDWSIRHDVIADLLPGGTSRTYWPYGGYVAQPFAVRVGCKPFETYFTRNGQAITYQTAILTVQYEKRPDTEPEELISESIEPTAEFLTLDHKRFTWTDADGDALEENEAPGRLVRGLTLSRTYHKVEPPLNTLLLTAIGHVNVAGYTSSLLGLTFAAETLMYCPPTMDRTITTEGSDGFNINVKFMYKPETWNKFWRTKTQLYAPIWDTEAAQVYKNYPTADFSSLLS